MHDEIKFFHCNRISFHIYIYIYFIRFKESTHQFSKRAPFHKRFSLISNSARYTHARTHACTHNTHTRLLALCQGLPGWAGTRKVKPIWILLKQQTVSGSGISWAICKSAHRSRQITTPAPHHSVFYRPDALPAAQPCQSTEGIYTYTRYTQWHRKMEQVLCVKICSIVVLSV